MSILVILFVYGLAKGKVAGDHPILFALRTRFKGKVSQITWQDSGDNQDCIAKSDHVILLFTEPPESLGQPTDLSQLCRQLMEKCVRLRKRLVHVVINIGAVEGSSQQAAWRMCKRAERMFIFHDLQEKPVDQVVSDIEKYMNNDRSFSSPGESFAWQLSAGFLSYIAPSLRDHAVSTLLDASGNFRADILRDYDLGDVLPHEVLVLPKLFVLLSERIVLGEVDVAMTPQDLFPGCRKISRALTDLCLEFDSPGYKKRVPVYILKLEKPITTGQSTVTHVVTFCSYAAPLYVIQKLDMADDEKCKTFQQFKHELQLIISHPKSNEMLRTFGGAKSTETDGSESSCVQLVDVSDQGSIESAILQATKSHLLQGQSRELPLQNPAQPAEADVDGDLPLMSMAYAMAANCWIGFAQLLMSHIQHLRSQSEPLPFDLPYCFVVPKSSRFPDEAKLLKRFAELGATQQQHQFQVLNGRRYIFRSQSWNSLRIAFEIPPSVLGIRKQAQCGIGGVRTEDLSAHLAEFRDALGRFVAASDGCFKVIEWDDVTDFVDDAWSEPSQSFALSLLCCLEKNMTH